MRMKKEISTVILTLVMVSGCMDNGGLGSVPYQTNADPPSFRIKLIYPIGPGIAILETSDIELRDIINTNYSWANDRTGIKKISENSTFITRMDLEYPLGNRIYEETTLVIKYYPEHIENIRPVNSELYPLLGSSSEPGNFGGTINVDKYAYGKLAEGSERKILFIGKTADSIITLNQDVPLFIEILSDDTVILKDTGTIEVIRSQQDIQQNSSS
ncbi:MAG: hypothetical protein V1921_04005 [Candidatus Altiarchaeota archaeon]